MENYIEHYDWKCTECHQRVRISAVLPPRDPMPLPVDLPRDLSPIERKDWLSDEKWARDQEKVAALSGDQQIDYRVADHEIDTPGNGPTTRCLMSRVLAFRVLPSGEVVRGSIRLSDMSSAMPLVSE